MFFMLVLKRIDSRDLTWSLFPDVPLFPSNFSHVILIPGEQAAGGQVISS